LIKNGGIRGDYRAPAHASASFLADYRVVFNLKGNTYRLDVKVSYVSQIVLIMRIGTHAEYNAWKF
jgi:mRNA interferase HigB